MDAIESIAPEEWELLVERRRSTFLNKIMIDGMTRSRSELGIRGFSDLLFLNGKWYWKKAEVEENLRFLQSKIREDEGLVLKIHDEAVQTASAELENYASTPDFSSLSNLELAEWVARVAESLLGMNTFLMIPHLLELHLSRKISAALKEKFGREKAVSLFNALMIPEKPGFFERSQEQFLELCLELKNAPSAEKLEDDSGVGAYLKEFAWIKDVNFRGDYLGKRELVEKIKSTLANENPSFELNYLKVNREFHRKAFDEAFGEINAYPEIASDVANARKIIFLRTYRTDVQYVLGYLVRGLFKEVALRLNATPALVYFRTAEELEQALSGGKPEDRSLDRKEKEGFACTNGKISELDGETVDRLAKSLCGEQVQASELRGQSACRGIVRGKVKIVQTVYDVGKVEEGDVLVSTMTRPDFMTAMGRAAAFVTDEGGITCHAAIISRELNKPCITGTKTATKVFKDGDVVEVDATRGVVKKC